MADEHAVEPPPGTPGQRALGAMESAVRRARAAGGSSPAPPESEAPERRPAARPTPPTRSQEPPAAPPRVIKPDMAGAPSTDVAQGGARSRSEEPPRPRPVGDVRILDGAPLGDAPRREDTLELPETEPRRPGATNRWLIGAVALLAALVIAAGIALIVSWRGGTSPPPHPAANPAPAGAPPARTPTTIQGPGTRHTTSTTTSSTTAPSTAPSAAPSTTVAVSPGGPPTIASLSPPSGAAGQTITVTGANFLSSSGQIVATFNGQVAPTSCPAQNSCTVTVPASVSPSAQVVITTSGGASNAVTFTYS